jgi:hypothetical protein
MYIHSNIRITDDIVAVTVKIDELIELGKL